MPKVWKLVGRVSEPLVKEKKPAKGRKEQSPEKRYATESGTLIVRTLSETETAQVLALLETMKAAEEAAIAAAPRMAPPRKRRIFSPCMKQTEKTVTRKKASAPKLGKSNPKKGRKCA